MRIITAFFFLTLTELFVVISGQLDSDRFQISLERVIDADEKVKNADKQVEEDLERIRKTLERLAKVSFSDQAKEEIGKLENFSILD
jgi:MFS superfamily sulfate permease-like transporter